MKYIINLKSTYYFLKNLVFTLFCIALGFLLGSGLMKAKAATSVDYNIIYEYINEKGLIYKHGGKSADLTDKINELASAMNSAGMNYSINIKGIPYSEGSNYSMFNIFIYEYNSDSVDIKYTATVETDVTKVATSSSLSNFITNGITINFPNPFSESAIFTNLDTLITYINENKHLPTSKIDGLTVVGNTSLNVWGFPTIYFNNDGTLNSSSTYKYLIYDTNVSFKISQTTNFDGFIINNNKYGVNSYLPSYKDVYLSGPKLTLKNSFNSGTNAPLTSKIIWEINPGTDLKTLDGIVNFKLQYGSNDFAVENIPNYLKYKMYGKNTSESEWTEINNHEQIYFDDFIYEYYDSEIIINGVLNLPNDMCIYEQIQVEFYFDNTVNFYMHVYDDLDNSSWSDVQKYFENYRLYEFPTNKKYAFISHSENIENEGKIYVPYNAIINPNILLSAYIYDFSINNTTLKLMSYSFEDENYYNYFDFAFSFDNNKVLMLQRKKSEEKLYFYVPNDYIVQFFDEKENNQIITPDGYVDIESDDINNIYDDESNSIFDYFNSFIDVDNPFFSSINELWELFKTSKIFDYIILLIVGTLIIILINALNR